MIRPTPSSASTAAFTSACDRQAARLRTHLTPPAAILLKKAAKIEKASGEPNRIKVARVSMDQVREIAKLKMPDLNAASLEAAMSMVAGTARSMGIDVG